MKLISLNIWGGFVREPLLNFVNAHQDVDFFCLQEVYHGAEKKISDDDKVLSLNIFSEFQALLPNHEGFFRPVVDHKYGIAMFVKKTIDILEEGDIAIHENPEYPGHGPTHSRNLQWLEFKFKNENYSIMNVHGLWNGKGKTDTPERIAQAKRIRDFMDSINTPKILCGDFNLRPDTTSINIIESGMNNLIRDFQVKSTRTSLYDKEERFADYIFTSPEVKVQQFQVLKHEVSDHAPLLLDFE